MDMNINYATVKIMGSEISPPKEVIWFTVNKDNGSVGAQLLQLAVNAGLHVEVNDTETTDWDVHDVINAFAVIHKGVSLDIPVPQWYKSNDHAAYLQSIGRPVDSATHDLYDEEQLPLQKAPEQKEFPF